MPCAVRTAPDFRLPRDLSGKRAISLLHLPPIAGPVRMKDPFRLVDTAIGVRTKVITLRLQQLRWQYRAAVGIEKRESGRQRRQRDTASYSQLNGSAPPGFSPANFRAEEIVQQDVRQIRLAVVGALYVIEETAPDNASGTPQQGDISKSQVPAILFSSLTHLHEALRVGNDLGGVKGIVNSLERVFRFSLGE